MKNIGQMMKQAQQMQARLGDLQTQLAAHAETGSAGGGAVEITLNGANELVEIKIKPEAAGDAEMLEDLVRAAHADARRKIEAHTKAETGKIMGGLNLPPGLKLPF